MRRLLQPLLLFAAMSFSGAAAWPQETQLPSDLPQEYRPPIMRENDEKEMPASAAKVAADAAVITIKGLCPAVPPTSPKSASADCHTIVTRAQFENLTDALLTNMKLSRKRQLAHAYPDLLAMAREAESRGIQNSPRFQERLAFARVQILSQELIRQIDEDSARVSDHDIETYYKTHNDQFETATLDRIFIPYRKRGNNPQTSDTHSESQKDVSEIAQELRAKAVAGQPFLALEKEAYAEAGIDEVPPNPSLGRVKQSSLPPAHDEVFNLKPGEISQVLGDSGGFCFYKVEAREKESLDAVRGEIQKKLRDERREAAIQQVQKPITADFNNAYFGLPEKPSGSGLPNPGK